MAVSTPTESRARQLLGKGANVDEVCRVTGLSKGAVITLQKAMKLPSRAADAVAPTSGHSRAACEPGIELRSSGIGAYTDVKNAATPSARRGMKPREALKDWAEKDWSDFIRQWNEAPVRSRMCESYEIDEETLDYALATLKRGGVMLRLPVKVALNFEALRKVAEESLTEEQKATIKNKSERAKERMAALKASGKMTGRRKKT